MVKQIMLIYDIRPPFKNSYVKSLHKPAKRIIDLRSKPHTVEIPYRYNGKWWKNGEIHHNQFK